MKYQPPWGLDPSDIDASYRNGDPSAGIAGSVPPAAAFEQPMRELAALISNSGLTPTDLDLEQVTRVVRDQKLNFFDAENVDGGTENAIVITITDPPPGALRAGLPVRIKIAQTNTNAATITVNGVGTYPAKRCNGAALEANDLLAGMVADFIFDGTNFQVVNFRGVTSATTNNNTYEIEIPYIADTSIVSNTITATFNPALVAHTTGKSILVKLANTVTDVTTININALAGKLIKKKFDQRDLDIGDCVVGEILLLTYDGAYYQLMNDVPPRRRLFLPYQCEINYPLDGRFAITTATGSVTIDAGQSWIWRSALEFLTSDFSGGERLLATVANKTYHLRWHAPGTGDAIIIGLYPNGRFVLKDVADAAYNPDARRETSRLLDGKFDDMLIARVVTNASNVPTVTRLENRMNLEINCRRKVERECHRSHWEDELGDHVILNWARAPENCHFRYECDERQLDEERGRDRDRRHCGKGLKRNWRKDREGKCDSNRYETWIMHRYRHWDRDREWEHTGPYDCWIRAWGWKHHDKYRLCDDGNDYDYDDDEWD